MTDLNLQALRARFPALNQEHQGQPVIFLDGPGGSQVPQSVLDAMTGYLGFYNSNLGGAFFSSHKTATLMADARQAAADLLNAESPEQIVFGPNMTSLTFSASRAIARDWQPGDEVIVTALDHYSNVSSWVQAAEDKGVRVHQVRINSKDCTLDQEHFLSLLNERTQLVALTYASNTTGSLVDVKPLVKAAHEVGALVYVDAVHYAPHELVDVQALDCDFLACSAYKFFGPHLGVLYAKRKHLEHFRPYKVAPAKDVVPNKWETGTQNYEALAGFIAAVEYLASIAGQDADQHHRRARLRASYALIKDHELALTTHMLKRLEGYPRIRLYGIGEQGRLAERTPTFALTFDGIEPRRVSEFLGKHNVCVWDGNFYAQGLYEQLGLTESGGVVRVGCMHYNRIEELDQLFGLFDQLLAS